MKPDAVTDDAGRVPFEGETSYSLVALGLTSSSCPIPDLLPIAQQPGWSFCQIGCMLLNTCHLLISLGEEFEDSQPSSAFMVSKAQPHVSVWDNSAGHPSCKDP